MNIINNDFVGNPEKLEFVEILTDNHSADGLLSNFDVFTGLTDNVEYIVYNNKLNFNLEIMTIRNKQIIKSLKGHNAKTTVIRYFRKNNNEDYILSCDLNKKVIVWDIQNDFFKKIDFLEKTYEGEIFDSLLLFDINNKDYILLSSGKREYSKLYDFGKEIKFIRDFMTNSGTEYLIYWKYTDKHYIIECMVNWLLIYNVLDNEIYWNHNIQGKHRGGFVFNDKFLFITSNNTIKILDLENKSFYKEIKHGNKYSFDIIPWNNKFIIIGTNQNIYIFNNDDYSVIKKIKGQAKGIKKIKINNLDECLICSDQKGNINLYKLS